MKENTGFEILNGKPKLIVHIIPKETFDEDIDVDKDIAQFVKCEKEFSEGQCFVNKDGFLGEYLFIHFDGKMEYVCNGSSIFACDFRREDFDNFQLKQLNVNNEEELHLFYYNEFENVLMNSVRQNILRYLISESEYYMGIALVNMEGYLLSKDYQKELHLLKFQNKPDPLDHYRIRKEIYLFNEINVENIDIVLKGFLNHIKMECGV